MTDSNDKAKARQGRRSIFGPSALRSLTSSKMAQIAQDVEYLDRDELRRLLEQDASVEPPAVEEPPVVTAEQKQPPRPGPDSDDTVTAAEVKAERQRRIVAGERHGVPILAKHFGCSGSTIRRRLGTLK